MTAKNYIYTWKNNPVRAKRYGQLCQIVAQASRKHSHRQFWRTCIVEFRDGSKMCTSLMALRRPEKYRSKQMKLWP